MRSSPALALLAATALFGGVAAGVTLSASVRAGANFRELALTVAVGDLDEPANLLVRIEDALQPALAPREIEQRIAGSGTYYLRVSDLTPGRAYSASVALGSLAVEAGSVTLALPTDAPWFTPLATNITLASTDAPVRVTTPSPRPQTLSRLELTATFSAPASRTALAAPETQTALAAARTALTIAEADAGAEGAVWLAWTGRAWKNLGAATPGAYTIRQETDLAGEKRRVRYSVKQDGAETFTVLTDGANDWIEDAGTDEGRAAEVAFFGAGSAANISGFAPDCAVAEDADGVRHASVAAALESSASVTLLADAEIDLAALASGSYTLVANGHALRWTDGDKSAFFSNDSLTVAEGASAGSGSSYERQALGLSDEAPPRVETSVETTSADSLRLNVAGFAPTVGTHAQVTVEQAASPDFTASTSTLCSGTAAEVGLGSTVNYFRVNIRADE